MLFKWNPITIKGTEGMLLSTYVKKMQTDCLVLASCLLGLCGKDR